MRFAFLVLSAVAALSASTSPAQDYPARPIRLIVANTPGTNVDTLARILAPSMSKHIGQPVVVENRAGANAMVGYEYVAKQVPADGYTLVIVVVSQLVTLPVMTKDIRFDPIKDLPPVVGIGEQRLVFGSSSSLPWKTFKEMIAHAKASPGKLNYGASSSLTRLTMEALIQDAGVSVVYVPYSSGGRFLQGLAAAEVQMGFVGEGSAVSMADKFRALAITGEGRRAMFPDVPTFAELGFPQVRGNSFTLNVPSGTPAAATEKLQQAAFRTLQQPEVRAAGAKIQVEIMERSASAAARAAAEEGKFYADIARKLGIQAQ